jgi:hypothetical protein
MRAASPHPHPNPNDRPKLQPRPTPTPRPRSCNFPSYSHPHHPTHPTTTIYEVTVQRIAVLCDHRRCLIYRLTYTEMWDAWRSMRGVPILRSFVRDHTPHAAAGRSRPSAYGKEKEQHGHSVGRSGHERRERGRREHGAERPAQAAQREHVVPVPVPERTVRVVRVPEKEYVRGAPGQGKTRSEESKSGEKKPKKKVRWIDQPTYIPPSPDRW